MAMMSAVIEVDSIVAALFIRSHCFSSITE
jgi:hypothetical protein